MKLSICTISFRHQLISIEQLATWARTNHFHGLELWGIHAQNLAESGYYGKDWLNEFGLHATMLSDYLPLQATESELRDKVGLLCRLARHWGARKIRTFAGNSGSADTSREARLQLIDRLQQICDWLAPHNLCLIIETHPNTFADTIDSTQLLFQQVARSNLKLNFDVLHVWESGADVLTALDQLHPTIDHFHLKNVRNREQLTIFSPDNVYSASGTREGMVSLFDGAVDYSAFVDYLNQHSNRHLIDMDASLEWFGHSSQDMLKRDRYLIQQRLQAQMV